MLLSVTLGFDVNVRDMTATITTSAFACGRAHIRSHFRQLATVVTVDGQIDDVNVDPVISYIRRMILVGGPLVLDLTDVKSSESQCISLSKRVAEDCRRVAVDWTLVASPMVSRLLDDSDDVAFPIASSVHEALHRFADGINSRRQMLLPLVRKTA